MKNSNKYFDPRTFAELPRLQLRARHLVEGYLAGQHRSPRHGMSLDFAQHRAYVPGDDLRHVDWKVFGRTDKVYVKQFEDETTLSCYLVLDTSRSMTYCGPDQALSKLQYAQCLVAALGWLVVRQQDAVGMLTIDQQIDHWLPPSSNPAQWMRLVDLLEQIPSAGGTALGPLMQQIARRIRRRSLVIVISDLLDDPESLLLGLAHLRYARHEVRLLQVRDPAEWELPFQQTTRFRDLEGGPAIVAEPAAIRAAYQQVLREHEQQLMAGCRQMRVPFQRLLTDGSLRDALAWLVDPDGKGLPGDRR